MNWTHYDVFVAYSSMSEWKKLVYSSLRWVMGLRITIQMSVCMDEMYCGDTVNVHMEWNTRKGNKERVQS